MGITGLLPFLSNLNKKVHVSQYSGKCVAVDTSCWLHRGAFSCAFELATGMFVCLFVRSCLTASIRHVCLSYGIGCSYFSCFISVVNRNADCDFSI